MRARSIILTSLVLALSWPAPAPAAPEPEEAVLIDSARPDRSAGAHISGLNPGKPSNLVLLHSWIAPTSNRFATNFNFAPTDDLELVVHAGFVQGSKRKPVIWSVSIRDEAGDEIFSDELRQQGPSTNYYFWAPDIGSFPIGLYQVKIKIKKGKNKVGMKYWFRVL